MTKFRVFAIASSLALALTMGTASAATVDIAFGSYARADLGTALAARDSFIGPNVALSEDFESFVGCTGENKHGCSSGTINSALGSFTGYGAVNTGGDSQIKPKDKIVVRSLMHNSYGRYNLTPGGLNWLDSNDREGIFWSFAAPLGQTFQKLAFLLTDVDDVGKILFNISVDGQAAVTRPSTAPGGDTRLLLISMQFDAPVSSFDIRMVNGTGDSFGMDGIRLAALPAPVPLPAAGLLLVGALGGIAAFAQRRKTV